MTATPASAPSRSALLAGLPSAVQVYEVGPRDGLQNELRTLATPDKVRLITALADAGLTQLEVTSFVSPRWVPQLADAEALLEALPRRPGVSLAALVPNLKGLERVKAGGIDVAAFFMSVTESHSKKNINKSVAEALETSRDVAHAAHAAGLKVRGYLSTVWGCPYEGLTPIAKVVEVVKRLSDVELDQLSLGDTIGVGTPGQTAEIIGEVSKVVPLEKIALHFHDTRGTALANVLVGLSMGVRTFDASIGGLGGCPYAPGAAGNLATEDLVYMLEGLGVRTGVSLPKLVDAGALAQELIGRKLPGKYLQAALGEREKQSPRRPTGQT